MLIVCVFNLFNRDEFLSICNAIGSETIGLTALCEDYIKSVFRSNAHSLVAFRTATEEGCINTVSAAYPSLQIAWTKLSISGVCELLSHKTGALVVLRINEDFIVFGNASNISQASQETINSAISALRDSAPPSDLSFGPSALTLGVGEINTKSFDLTSDIQTEQNAPTPTISNNNEQTVSSQYIVALDTAVTMLVW